MGSEVLRKSSSKQDVVNSILYEGAKKDLKEHFEQNALTALREYGSGGEFSQTELGMAKTRIENTLKSFCSSNDQYRQIDYDFRNLEETNPGPAEFKIFIRDKRPNHMGTITLLREVFDGGGTK